MKNFSIDWKSFKQTRTSLFPISLSNAMESVEEGETTKES